MRHRSSHRRGGWAATLLSVFLIHATVAAEAASRSLDVRLCGPVPPGTQATLPDPFRPFERSVRQCRLDRGARPERLFVVTVWIADVADEGSPDLARQTVPLPVLIDAQGRRLGDLPAPFPDDPPLFTQLQVTYDRTGWPVRIQQTARTDAIGTPPRFTPLVWNPKTNRFTTR